jgi:hypothetical protein
LWENLEEDTLREGNNTRGIVGTGEERGLASVPERLKVWEGVRGADPTFAGEERSPLVLALLPPLDVTLLKTSILRTSMYGPLLVILYFH